MKKLLSLFKRKKPSPLVYEILRTTKGDLSIFYNVKGEQIRGFSSCIPNHTPSHWSDKYYSK